MAISDKAAQSCPSLAKVHRGNLCAGCGGCALVAPDKIKMTLQPPGFLRPVQTAPVSPEEDLLISRICPGLGQTVDAGARIDDVMWGPYISMQTGWSTDPDLRYTASSGGALSAVLVHLLKSGTVDAVIQTAASPTVPVANVSVLSESAEDILKAAGSRYAPSAPLADLEQYLNSPKRFAFVGKPCDVAALRALSRYDDRVDQRILVMLSFFCGGLPSQTGAEQVLTNLGTDLSSTKAFRYRGHGWPGRATATLANGSERSMTYHDSWGKILSKHVQLRCKVCADGTGKDADIVCADSWETDAQGYPLFEEQEGSSLIVTRTTKGQTLLEACAQGGDIILHPFEVEKLISIQPGQTARRRALFARLAGLRLQGRAIPKYKGLHILENGRSNRLGVNLKNFLGMIRRGLTGKLG